MKITFSRSAQRLVDRGIMKAYYINGKLLAIPGVGILWKAMHSLVHSL